METNGKRPVTEYTRPIATQYHLDPTMHSDEAMSLNMEHIRKVSWALLVSKRNHNVVIV
jgi:hypothetical protein